MSSFILFLITKMSSDFFNDVIKRNEIFFSQIIIISNNPFLVFYKIYLSLFFLSMFLRLLLMICLFELGTNLTIKDSSSQYNSVTDIDLLSNTNNQNIYSKNTQIHIKLNDIIFISTLSIFFFTIFICLYCQRSLINFIFKLSSKAKNNNSQINEHVTILHRTPPWNNLSSNCLTVPQQFYHH
jgi:hypothetical protein